MASVDLHQSTLQPVAMDSKDIDTPGEKEHNPIPTHSGAPALTSLSLSHNPTTLPTRVQVQWVFALNCVTFLQGSNDSTAGPLLLSMQAYYGVTYDVVSIIWICNFVGNFLAGLFTMWITDKIGFGKTVALGAATQTVAYIILACRPPLPLFLISYLLVGMGTALQASQVNGFIGRLPGAKTKMYLNQAVYGFSGMLVSIVATHFASVELWRYQYVVLAGIATIDYTALTLAFRWKRDKALFAKYGYIPADDLEELASQQQRQQQQEGSTEIPSLEKDSPNKINTSSPPSRTPTTSNQKMRKIVRNPSIWLIAIFFWLYVGAEVGIAGWAVTFMVKQRGGEQPGSGYISTGVFAGLTCGRLLQIWVGTKVRERTIVPIYVCLALALQLVFWLVPNFYVSAVAVGLVGLCLGPMSPIVFNVTMELLPVDLKLGGLSVVFMVGNSGSATFPWMMGALAQAFGVWSMNPLAISLFVGMLVFWEGVFFCKPRAAARLRQDDGGTETPGIEA